MPQEVASDGSSPPAYACSRLNTSTHLIIHNDTYEEYPFIYVKVYQDPLRLAVVIDTGCGARSTVPSHGKHRITELKTYIKQELLDPQGTQADYEFVVICTHCHFDHIGGIEAFATDSKIIASGYDRKFLDPSNRGSSSLCPAFGLPTPQYEISHFASHGERLTYQDKRSGDQAPVDIGLHILHTPGHTPDSMSIYDVNERWLFVGDTLYHRRVSLPWGAKQDVPIIIPNHGSFSDFRSTLKLLQEFVEEEERKNPHAIHLAAGHTTSAGPAKEMIATISSFFTSILQGKVPIVVEMTGDQVAPGGSLGDELYAVWEDERMPDVNLIAPRRFLDTFSS